MVTFDPDRILNALTLRPRRRTEEEKRHGSFNNRMMAATLDSLVVTLLLAPLVDIAFNYYYGPGPISFNEIGARVQAEGETGHTFSRMVEIMKETGFWDRAMLNYKWQIAVLCVYVTICWHAWSATPGKMLLKLKIVDAKTGEPMKDWQSIMRVVGYFISAIPFGLGFFWIGLNKQKRGWHDYLANTLVIQEPWFKRKKSEATSAPLSDLPSDSPAP